MQGSHVALITPFKENGMIDYICLQNLIEWHVGEKTDGIVVLGTTGESPTLSSEEKEKTITAARSITQHKIPLIAGTGSNDSYKTYEDTKKARDLGVDACLIIAPYYNRPSQKGGLSRDF